jgi:rhodanese-related sulfurtransferase/DNA-binding transcriptional ArsR family regulator
MGHRQFKDRLYAEFARVGGALGSERRLELLDLLAQAPRHVEALASETEMSVANVSQHLQVLRRARLVETDREGTKVLYRLADERVLQLWLALRSVAEARLAEVEQIAREFAVEGAEDEAVLRADLEGLRVGGDVVVIDVRPAIEYEHGHLPDAISLPLEELAERLDELPRDRRIVAYCRGAYCFFADEAVALLRRRGFDAHRLEGGWPEWRAEGRPVARSLVK